MQKSITLKKSLGNMTGLIKKSKGLFFKFVLAVLIPLLIINCYNATVNGKSIAVDFSKVDSFDFDDLSNQNYFTEFADILTGVYTYNETKASATDTVFAVLEYLLTVFADVFVIVLAVHLYFDKKYNLKDLIKLSLRRCFPVIFFGLFASWALSYVSSTVHSGIVGVGVFLRASSNGSALAQIGTVTYVGSALLQLALAVFIVSFVMMLVFYSVIASVSGRCRWFIAVQYVFEVLRKKKFKQMLHFVLPVLFAYILPTVMLTVGTYTDITASIILTCIAVTVQTVLNAMLWNYAVSDYFILEKESGIEEKIRNFIRRSGQNNPMNGNGINGGENTDLSDKTEGDNGENRAD